EAGRVLVVVGPGHARIAVVEELLAVDAQDPGRRGQLGGAHLGQPRAVLRLVHVVDLTDLAAGGGHEHDPVAVGVCLLHHAAGHDRLVVGMGVDQEKGAHSSANSLASPPVPGRPTTRSAAARTSGGAPSTATASPAQLSIGTSLRPSPAAAVWSWGTASSSARNWRAVPLSAWGMVISR